MDWVRLAGTVIRYRKRRGWWQHDLAARSGMSVRTIRRIESGREPVSETALLAIEAALGWQYGSAEAVLKGGKPRAEIDEDLAAIIHVWPRLPQNVRRVIRTMAEESAG